MPVRFLSDAELARLSGWPSEIAADDLVTFFTLTTDDLSWLSSSYRYENGWGRRSSSERCPFGLDTR